jgi:hypothetical protein
VNETALTEIRSWVEERTLQGPPRDEVGPYVERILQIYGDKVVGIFMYGSMLSSVTSTTTSFPDFFVVTDGYRGVFRRFSHWALAYPLPPHIYHLRLDEQRRCKYNLVSLGRFRRECSRRAKDIYILGRFGKRVSLVHYRDEQARRELIDCCASAMVHVSRWTLRGMKGAFDAEEFTLACLNISYAGETRVEATSKVPKLFNAEKTLYLKVYPRVLAELAQEGKCQALTEPGHYQVAGGGFHGFRLRWFLKWSRIRGMLRWPKFLVTVDEWVDIILAKIERTKGIKLCPSPRARRHPLIFGWPYLFKLIRAGAIGSSAKPPDKGECKQ